MDKNKTLNRLIEIHDIAREAYQQTYSEPLASVVGMIYALRYCIEQGKEPPIICENCGWGGDEHATDELGPEDCSGGGVGTIPVGVCPVCSTLVYFTDDCNTFQAMRDAYDKQRLRAYTIMKTDARPAVCDEAADLIDELAAALEAILTLEPDCKGDIILPTGRNPDDAPELSEEYRQARAALAKVKGE